MTQYNTYNLLGAAVSGRDGTRVLLPLAAAHPEHSSFALHGPDWHIGMGPCFGTGLVGGSVLVRLLLVPLHAHGHIPAFQYAICHWQL